MAESWAVNFWDQSQGPDSDQKRTESDILVGGFKHFLLPFGRKSKVGCKRNPVDPKS